jgi:hypothetical protein
LTVHAIDGGLGFVVTAHFYKTKTFGTARVTFHHDFGAGHHAKLTKSLFQISVSNRIWQVANVKFIAHKRDSSKHINKSDGVPKAHSTSLITTEGKRN